MFVFSSDALALDALVEELGVERLQHAVGDAGRLARSSASPSMSTSGSTIGTRPASWERAANRASACAFVQMQ